MNDSYILTARSKAAPAGYNDRVLYASTDLELVEALLREGRFESRLPGNAVFALLHTVLDTHDFAAEPMLVGTYDRQGSAVPHPVALAERAAVSPSEAFSSSHLAARLWDAAAAAEAA